MELKGLKKVNSIVYTRDSFLIAGVSMSKEVEREEEEVVEEEAPDYSAEEKYEPDFEDAAAVKEKDTITNNASIQDASDINEVISYLQQA